MRRATTIGSGLPHPLKPAAFSTFSGSGGSGRGRGSPTTRFSFIPPPPPGQAPKPELEGAAPPSSFASPDKDSPSADSFISAIGAGRGNGVGGESRFPFYPGQAQAQRDPPLQEPNMHVRSNAHGGYEGNGFPFQQGGEQWGPPQRGPPQRGPPSSGHGGYGGGEFPIHHGQVQRGPPQGDPTQRGPPSHEHNMNFRSSGGGNRGGEFSFNPGQAQRGPPSQDPNMHVRSSGHGGYRGGGGGGGGGFPLHQGTEQRGPPPQWEFQEREVNRDAKGDTGVGGDSLSENNTSLLSGAGRGGPASHHQMQQQEPNRHVRVGIRGGAIGESVPSPRPGAGWDNRAREGPPSHNQMQYQQPEPNSNRGNIASPMRGREGPPSHNQMQYQQPEPNSNRGNIASPLRGREGPASRNRMPERETDELDRHGRSGQWKSSPVRQAPQEGERGRAGFGGGRGMTDSRGRGRGKGMEGGRGKGRGRGRFEKEEESRRMVDLLVGDNADGELFESRLGFQVMRQLDQGFEEVVSRTMPSPVDEAYLNAIDLNHRLEFEPEFLMGELDSNPDIDDKEPILLRDALMKAKPFLMAYEGIESHDEWEEIVEETIKGVPDLKKIVDHYCGSDRVTAKQQNEELEKVAKTLPETVPDSIKVFTNRALLSLQSNPGWEFHRKRQFMDKLVTQMSQNQR